MPSSYAVLRFSLYAILACLFLTPEFQIAAGIPQLRAEEILIAAVAVYVMVASLAGAPVRFAWGLGQVLLTVFTLAILVSIITGLYLGHGGALGDLVQMIRMGKYIAIYTICLTVVNLSIDKYAEVHRILKFTLFVSFLLFLICVQQYYDLFRLNALYVDAIEPYHSQYVYRSRGRVIGMIGNPNELGFLLAIAALVAAYFLLMQRFRLVYPLLLATYIVGILMTGSRSSLISCTAGVLALAALAVLRARGIRLVGAIRVLAMALVVILAGVVAGATLPGAELNERLLWRFQELSDPMEVTSWQARLVRWQDNLELFKESPVLGVGPLRRIEDMGPADSEWLLLLRSYGIIGTSLLVLAVLLPHWLSARTAVHALASAVLLASALMMIPTGVFHVSALMSLVLIVLALGDTRFRIKVLPGAGAAGGRTWLRTQQGVPIRDGGGRLRGAAGSPRDL